RSVALLCLLRRPPVPTLLPYTTLFRSPAARTDVLAELAEVGVRAGAGLDLLLLELLLEPTAGLVGAALGDLLGLPQHLCGHREGETGAALDDQQLFLDTHGSHRPSVQDPAGPPTTRAGGSPLRRAARCYRRGAPFPTTRRSCSWCTSPTSSTPRSERFSPTWVSGTACGTARPRRGCSPAARRTSRSTW